MSKKIGIAGRWLFALGLVTFAGAARGETPRWTVRALGAASTSLSGSTAATVSRPTESLAISSEETRDWLGLDLDFRLYHWLSLDLGVSQGGLREIETVFPRGGSGDSIPERRSGSLRHTTLSVLYHPLAEHRVDLYLGPTVGLVRFDHSFSSSEGETVEGGKLGFDVRLAETRWVFTGELSVLSGPFRLLDDLPKRNATYSRIAAGIGYRW